MQEKLENKIAVDNMTEKHPRITNHVIKEQKIITQICNLALIDNYNVKCKDPNKHLI